MQWAEICQSYPDQWLIIEALQAHTTANNRRLLDKIAIIERCQDGMAAMQSYRRMHLRYPTREFYFAHTSRKKLDIHERQWAGIRGGWNTLTSMILPNMCYAATLLRQSKVLFHSSHEERSAL